MDVRLSSWALGRLLHLALLRLGPVFWILMAEIFAARIRGIGMSVAVFVKWFSDSVVILFFPWLLKHLGGAFTFGLTAAIAFGMIFVAWTMIPDTSGRPLEQIEEFWGH